jgi:hypothetical protein
MTAYAAGGHFVLYTGFAVGLPLVGTSILSRDPRERRPKGNTSHEVTARRAGGPSGRTQSQIR